MIGQPYDLNVKMGSINIGLSRVEIASEMVESNVDARIKAGKDCATFRRGMDGGREREIKEINHKKTNTMFIR